MWHFPPPVWPKDTMRSLALLLGVKAACILLVSSLSGTGAVNNSGRWWWVHHMLHAMMHSLSYQHSTTEGSHLAPGWPQGQHFIGVPHSIPHARNNVLVLAPFTTSVQPLRGGKKEQPHDIIACGIFSCRFQIAPCGLNYKQTFHLFIYLLYKCAVPLATLFRAHYIFFKQEKNYNRNDYNFTNLFAVYFIHFSPTMFPCHLGSVVWTRDKTFSPMWDKLNMALFHSWKESQTGGLIQGLADPVSSCTCIPLSARRPPNQCWTFHSTFLQENGICIVLRQRAHWLAYLKIYKLWAGVVEITI